MKTICITLDDVIRAKTKQFGKIFKKAGINPDLDIDSLTLETNQLKNEFQFKDAKEFKKFLYDDYPFEIFAEAGTVTKSLSNKLNLWLIKLSNEEELEDKFKVILANPYEFNTSIGYTYFFLSQIATRVREVFLPADSSEIWDRCDILITADPKLLDEKPVGKTSIKIDTTYNKKCEADYSYEKLEDFLEDDERLKELASIA